MRKHVIYSFKPSRLKTPTTREVRTEISYEFNTD